MSGENILKATPTPSNNLNNGSYGNIYELSSERIISNFSDYVDVSNNSLNTYIKGVRAFFLFLNEKGIKIPVREDVIAFRNNLIKTHKATTVSTYLAGVRSFFSWLGILGLEDICKGVKSVKLDKDFKKDCLTRNQAKKLLAAIDTENLRGKRDFAILSLMLTTGLRDIEVVRANVEDMRVVSGADVLFIQGKGKSEKSEFVKLALPVKSAISSWIHCRSDVSGNSPLFCSISNHGFGERLTTRSVSRLVKARLQAIGLDSERLTAHSLRHSAATLNLLAGGTLEETQQLLRHSSIVTTQTYAHHLERMKNNSEDRISDLIFE